MGADPVPLPHENKSERLHYREYYDQVASRFNWSIKQFCLLLCKPIPIPPASSASMAP
jgi:hypothetical protein